MSLFFKKNKLYFFLPNLPVVLVCCVNNYNKNNLDIKINLQKSLHK